METAPVRIIGRQHELATLRHLATSNHAEFLAIYGRRRVGKTFLIRRFFEDIRVGQFYVMGQSDGDFQIQLSIFQKSIEETFHSGFRLPKIHNWSEAMELLVAGLKKAILADPNRIWLVFLDELPWLHTPKSNLLRAIDHTWNTELQYMPQVKLVVCGSAASWMLRKIVHAKGGLHNRLTETIRLEPFTLRETREFIHEQGITLQSQQVLELYMAFGGIPFYLNLMRRGESPTQAVSRLCYGGGTLSLEFDRLFKALFLDGEQHAKLIRKLATKRKGLTRQEALNATSSTTGGTFDRRLKELEESGFITTIQTQEGKTEITRYRVIDEFVLFHLKWIEGAPKGALAPKAGENYFEMQSRTPSFNSWAGFAFEGICLKHAAMIKSALGISVIPCRPATWAKYGKKGDSQTGAQIDLLFDRNDGVITICEIKYCDKPFLVTAAYSKTLEHKMAAYKEDTDTQKSIYLAIIAPQGIVDNEHARRLVGRVVTSDDLFGITPN